MSANGWNQGGPTLHWTLALTFLSTHCVSSPTTAVNRRPGKMRIVQNQAKC